MPGGRGRKAWRDKEDSSSSSSDSSPVRYSRRKKKSRSRSRTRSRSVASRLRQVHVTQDGTGAATAGRSKEDGLGQARGGQHAVGGVQEEAHRTNPVNIFRRLLSDQQENISQLLAEQRQELFEKVEKSKTHKFRQRVLEKQYEVNEEFCNISRCVQSALKKGHIEKARAKIEELTEDLEAHGEDIIAADLSRHGWLTVQRLRNKSVKSNFCQTVKFLSDSQISAGVT